MLPRWRCLSGLLCLTRLRITPARTGSLRPPKPALAVASSSMAAAAAASSSRANSTFGLTLMDCTSSLPLPGDGDRGEEEADDDEVEKDVRVLELVLTETLSLGSCLTRCAAPKLVWKGSSWTDTGPGLSGIGADFCCSVLVRCRDLEYVKYSSNVTFN